MSMEATPQVWDREDCEVIDGCLVTPDGEVVGTVDFEGVDQVDREETADAMLARIAEVQAQVIACRIRRDAVVAQYAAMERRHQQRLDYLKWRFGPMLEQYAKHRLQFSKKRRSFDLPHGRLGFRKQAASARIVDMDRAVVFLREVGRADLIKIRTVETASPGDVAPLLANADRADFLEVTPERDKFSIDTGLPD
jgi:hypothetical protein